MAFPRYRVEMDTGSATTAWYLGFSRLGVDTILRAAAVPITAAPMIETPGPKTISIQRGRQDELGQIQAGMAAVTMDNTDGRYSPGNTASPYAGAVVPRRRMRVSASQDGGTTWYPLFWGYVNSIRPDDVGLTTDVTFGATDWMGRSQKVAVTAARPAESASARIAAIVAAMGSDNLPQAFDTDDPATVQGSTLTDANGIQHIQDVTTVSRGVFFQRADGTLAYHSRYRRWKTPGAFKAAAVFGRDVTGSYGGSLVAPIAPGSLAYDYDDKYLYNDVQVHATATGEGQQTAADTDSQAAYGRVTFTLDSDLLPAGAAAPLAAHILSCYRVPVPRVHALTVDLAQIQSADQATLWPLLWGLEVGDTVRVVKDLPSALGIDATMFVEGIGHSIGIDASGFVGHTIALQLADRRSYGPAPWILGTSRLGVDTIIAY